MRATAVPLCLATRAFFLYYFPTPAAKPRWFAQYNIRMQLAGACGQVQFAMATFVVHDDTGFMFKEADDFVHTYIPVFYVVSLYVHKIWSWWVGVMVDTGLVGGWVEASQCMGNLGTWKQQPGGAIVPLYLTPVYQCGR